MVLRPSHAGAIGRFAAVAVLALAAAAPAASAQSVFQFLTPDPSYAQVQANLSRYGYTLRSGVAHRGDTYVLDARDRQGMMERLVLDANSGRIVQRYALSEPTLQSPQRTAPFEGGSWRPSPPADVPVVQRRADLDSEDGDADSRPAASHKHDFAYGGGRAEPFTPPTPEPKPAIEKPKQRFVRPKPAPVPSASATPEASVEQPAQQAPAAMPSSAPTTAVVPETATAPVKAAPAPTTAVAPATATAPVKAAPAPQPSVGTVASTAPAEQPAAKTEPPAPPKPATKSKSINDIPVSPLD